MIDSTAARIAALRARGAPPAEYGDPTLSIRVNGRRRCSRARTCITARLPRSMIPCRLAGCFPGSKGGYSASGEDASWGEAVGELLLSGPQVVSGYWQDPAATERSFVRLPLDEAQRVWYRTGDLVGWDERDAYTFHRRCDHQIKVRGYRVDLQETESVLRRLTGSELVAVVPVDPQNGRCENLVAFCNRASNAEADVQEQCRTYLPDYMVPGRILIVEDFPRNDNGKISYSELSRRIESTRKDAVT